MTVSVKTRNFILLGGVALAAVLVPALLIKLGLIDAYTAQIFTLAGINAIMAISVNIITGVTGQLTLGQAGFMAIGAYTCIWFSQVAHLPLPLAVLTGALFAAFAGFLIGFPTLKLSGDY
ncbi:MAG TPA: branched-chain amino acid ABC transporter permease, partial [Treponemataceae bacterium]|nr:branched-chain amino acid ABC transporter permease [Treponemataceae bacterium]